MKFKLLSSTHVREVNPFGETKPIIRDYTLQQRWEFLESQLQTYPLSKESREGLDIKYEEYLLRLSINIPVPKLDSWLIGKIYSGNLINGEVFLTL